MPRFLILFCYFLCLNAVSCVILPNRSSVSLKHLNEYILVPDYKIELNMKNPRHSILSPGFPDEYYPPNTQIIYEVNLKLDDYVMQKSSRIILTFEMFSLQDSEFCAKDGLEIADSSSNQIRVYCGVQVGRTVLSEGNKIYIRFFTDSSQESRGYSILLEIYNTACSKHFKDVLEGTFTTPNYPERYYPDDLCVWKIDAPENKRIRVEFEEAFDIRAYEPLCVQDFLAVSLTGDFDTHVKRYCHGKRPVSMYSTGNSMLFLFRTDCCFEGKGFKATFTVVDEDEIISTPPPDPLPQMCTCGIENIQESERILGGKEVDPPHRYPWVVALMKKKNGKNDYYCGGVLINKEFVLTAAHCIEKEKVSETKIAIAAHDSSYDTTTIPASRFILHPNYRRKIYFNDIALIKLEVPATFNQKVSPICLPTETGFISEGTVAVVTGWGIQSFEFSTNDTTLQEVEVPVISHAKCVAKYGGVVIDSNICAGGEEGKDACGGDSGGALSTKHDGRWHAVGIVSWGSGCGRQSYPGVYTRVSEYLQWIRNETKGSVPCEEEVEPPVQPNLHNCGIPNTDSSERIVGGIEATPFEFPWMAMIIYERRVIGAGALISPYYVITAASIFDNVMEWYPELIDVFLGRHSLSKGKDSTSKRFTVRAVYHHPRYGKPSPYNNDVAVLRLNVPEGGVSDVYRPICLPRSDAWYPHGLSLTTAGWGSTSSSGDGSNVLMKVDLYAWSEEGCKQRYPRWFTENMLCAYKQGSDTCYGDNGAPLMRFYSGRYYLAGVSSWASQDGCAVRNAPRVFSAVHANLRWISDTTGLETL